MSVNWTRFLPSLLPRRRPDYGRSLRRCVEEWGACEGGVEARVSNSSDSIIEDIFVVFLFT